MRTFVTEAEAPRSTRRAARNHLDLAASWNVFGPDGLTGDTSEPTLLDLSEIPATPVNAVVRAVVAGWYRTRLRTDEGVLPWLLVDEAKMFFDGIAAASLSRVLTRGRAPGVSIMLATQQPGALPDVAITQVDLLIAHELSGPAWERFATTRPEYRDELASACRPATPGEAVILDDATSSVHPVRIPERCATHAVTGPRAGQRALAQSSIPD